jgi:hypothetical protein
MSHNTFRISTAEKAYNTNVYLPCLTILKKGRVSEWLQALCAEVNAYSKSGKLRTGQQKHQIYWYHKIISVWCLYYARLVCGNKAPNINQDNKLTKSWFLKSSQITYRIVVRHKWLEQVWYEENFWISMGSLYTRFRLCVSWWWNVFSS